MEVLYLLWEYFEHTQAYDLPDFCAFGAPAEGTILKFGRNTFLKGVAP